MIKLQDWPSANTPLAYLTG